LVNLVRELKEFLFLSSLLLFIYLYRILICSPGRPWTQNPPASASWALRFGISSEKFLMPFLKSFDVMRFEQRASHLLYHLSSFLCWVFSSQVLVTHLLGRCFTTWVLFCVGYFQVRVLWTICSGWPQTMIFLISASRVEWTTSTQLIELFDSK
jgi:hypothetical protein